MSKGIIPEFYAVAKIFWGNIFNCAKRKKKVIIVGSQAI